MLLLLLSTVATEYIKLLDSNEFLGFGTVDGKNLVIPGPKESAADFELRQSRHYKDKVVFVHDRTIGIFVDSSSPSLRSSRTVVSAFDLLLAAQGNGIGFILKKDARCLGRGAKEKELVMGGCDELSVVLLTITENTSGSRIDDLLVVSKFNRVRKDTDPVVPEELKWTAMSPVDVKALVAVFDKDLTRERERTLVLFNKF